MNKILSKIEGNNGGKKFVSSRGQAIDLITEATDLNNLSRMYIGWSAFI